MVKCYNWGKLERLETVHSCPARALNKIISVEQHSEGECYTLVVEHVPHAGVMGNGILNSSATCHMCHNEMLFSELQPLEKGTDMTLH